MKLYENHAPELQTIEAKNNLVLKFVDEDKRTMPWSKVVIWQGLMMKISRCERVLYRICRRKTQICRRPKSFSSRLGGIL
jgi:hypothetical protein